MTQLALLDAALKPAFRNTDPETARLAAEVAGRSKQRMAVLCALYQVGGYGLTDYECAQRLDLHRSSAGKRRGELRRLGLVEDSGKRRPTDSGVSAVVWILTAEGIDAWYQQTRRRTEEVSVGEFL